MVCDLLSNPRDFHRQFQRLPQRIPVTKKNLEIATANPKNLPQKIPENATHSPRDCQTLPAATKHPRHLPQRTPETPKDCYRKFQRLPQRTLPQTTKTAQRIPKTCQRDSQTLPQTVPESTAKHFHRKISLVSWQSVLHSICHRKPVDALLSEIIKKMHTRNWYRLFCL